VTSALALRRRRPLAAVLTAEVAEAAAGALALGGLLALVAGIALAASERPSVLAPVLLHRHAAAWLAGPLAGHWPALTSDPSVLRWYATLALLGMLACWAVATACARRVGLVPVLLSAFAADAALVLAPPSSLADTFNYLHYGRMLPLYGLNPYTHLPLAASADPAYHLSTWHHLTSPYGPLFTLGTELLAPLSVPAAYWTLKVAVGLAAAGVAVLVALLARRLGRDPARAVAFVALNPLVLFYGVEGLHNDVFVILLLLAGALLVVNRREVLGGSAWAGAAAVKLSAGLALPILVLGAGRRGRAAAGVALGGVAALVMVRLAFGGHLPNDAVQARLVDEISPANLLGVFTGHGGLDAALRSELRIVLVMGTAGLCAWTWRTRDWSTAAAWAAALLIMTLGWVMPWYVLWVLPFAALSGSVLPKAAAVALTVMLLAMWVPARVPALHHLGWHPPHTQVSHANALYWRRLLR
jgi:Glycosyltransferase family 87